MAIVLSLIALFFPFAAGIGAVNLLCRGEAKSVSGMAGTALLLGVGIVSLLSFSLGFFVQGPALRWIVATVCMALPITAAARYRRNGAIPRTAWRTGWGIASWALLTVLVGQLSFLTWLSLYRYGLGWDGLFVWEAKAHIAFLHGGAMPLSFYTSGYEISHAAYPMLLPMLQVWIYGWIGHIDQSAIKLIGPYFHLAGVLVVVGSARVLTYPLWVRMLAAVLIGFVPALVINEGSATSGYADFPLAIMFLCAGIHCIEYWRTGAATAIRLASASAMFLPFIKAEGAVLFLCVVLAVLPKIVQGRNWWAGLWITAPGLAVWAGWVVFLKVTHTDTKGDFLPVTWDTFAANYDRIRVLASLASQELVDWRRWGLLWPLTGLAAITLFKKQRIEWYPGWATVILPLVIYPSVFVFSAWGSDITVHVQSALWRLYLQVAPSAVVFVVIAFGRELNNRPDRPISEREANLLLREAATILSPIGISIQDLRETYAASITRMEESSQLSTGQQRVIQPYLKRGDREGGAGPGVGGVGPGAGE